jgi:hypothetical protein
VRRVALGIEVSLVHGTPTLKFKNYEKTIRIASEARPVKKNVEATTADISKSTWSLHVNYEERVLKGVSLTHLIIEICAQNVCNEVKELVRKAGYVLFFDDCQVTRVSSV